MTQTQTPNQQASVLNRTGVFSIPATQKKFSSRFASRKFLPNQSDLKARHQERSQATLARRQAAVFYPEPLPRKRGVKNACKQA